MYTPLILNIISPGIMQKVEHRPRHTLPVVQLEGFGGTLRNEAWLDLDDVQRRVEVQDLLPPGKGQADVIEGARDVPCLVVHPEQGAQRLFVGPATAEGKAEARAAHDPAELVAGGVAVVGVRR